MALSYSLEQLLRSIKDYNASDLHLNVGVEPMLRIDGKLTPLNLPKLLYFVTYVKIVNAIVKKD